MNKTNQRKAFCAFLWLTEEFVNGGDDPEGDGGDEGGGGDGENPGPDDAAGDAPFDC